MSVFVLLSVAVEVAAEGASFEPLVPFGFAPVPPVKGVFVGVAFVLVVPGHDAAATDPSTRRDLAIVYKKISKE